MQEDWPLLVSFFPDQWIEMASSTGALKGLRQDKDAENYIRTLLIHIGCGYSMRETVIRAKRAGLADISDVAFLKRLRKAKDWLHSLCVALFEERRISPNVDSGFQLRLFDGTTVKEPGKTGSQWRIHFSLRIPSLQCDFFKLTATHGNGTGESFSQYPIHKGDHIIADRGYSKASGIHHVASKKAYVTVRVNTGTLPMLDIQGAPFPLLKKVSLIKKAGTIRSWRVLIPWRSRSPVEGRLCVVRKTEQAIRMTHEKLMRNASKKGHKIKPETLEYAKYVILFTTYQEDSFSDFEVLDWYRIRWQVELVFKRFKSIAQLGHLPKHNDDSSKSWLYGKMFVALLIEKLIAHATAVSPWGYDLEKPTTDQPMA